MKTTEIEDDSGGEWKVLAELLGIDGPVGASRPNPPEKPPAAKGHVLVMPVRPHQASESTAEEEPAQAEGAQSETAQEEAAPADKQTLLRRGWAALPEGYRMPEAAPTVEEAQAWCRHLAETHYENFHVASWFLPKAFRPHFYSIYAYCRVSDDLGDEVGDPEVAMALLEAWGEELDACYAGSARHPVFVALAETIKACSIPKEPFADLLTAFRQDQTVTRYATMEDVLGYCKYSANPVGRLVLYATGEAEIDREEKFRLSDKTCTALQLANFWQDVTVDQLKDRVYLPLDLLAKHNYSVDELFAHQFDERFRGIMREAVDRARGLFLTGLPLAGKVNRRLAVDLELFSRGGMKVLDKIEQQNYDVLSRRPKISKVERAGLLIGTLARVAFQRAA